MSVVKSFCIAQTGDISGTITNVIFTHQESESYNYGAFNATNISGTVSYVKSNGNIVGNFSGQLLDCEFDLRGTGRPVIGDNIDVFGRVTSDAIIERCKLLTDTGVDTITAASPNTPVQILYTVINNGTLNISATPSTNNYNISTW